jgi:hypothetical protein
MALEQVVTAPRSPWQNACVEHIIGSIRRECLDHIFVFDERHLRRVPSAALLRRSEAGALGTPAGSPHRKRAARAPTTEHHRPWPSSAHRCQGRIGFLGKDRQMPSK